MRRRKRQQPERENPHEARILRAVEAAGVSDEERPFYLAFARELDVSLRRALPKRQAQAQAPEPAPWTDFTRSTKLVVQRWFERGLSGHKLWLICSFLLQNPDSGTAFSTCHR